MNATIDEPQTTENAEHTSSAAGNNREQRTLKRPIAPEHALRNTPTPQPASPPAADCPPSELKTMDKGRFCFGMLLSSAGVGLLLSVAVGIVQQFGAGGRFSLPLVAFTAIAGVMMLGGGFGVMATASAGLDDGEFERLMEAGNISNVCRDRSDSCDESSDAEQWPNVPTGGSGEQRDADEV